MARTPPHRPPSTISSTANHRSHSAAAVARTSSTSARSISAPVAAPPACTTRGDRVPALAGQQQAPLPVAVEAGAHGDQLVDPARALVDQHPHGVHVAQPHAGGQRVGQVEVGGVGVAAEHRGHASLGPARGGLVQLALGQHADAQAGLVGGPHGGRQAGHAAADDEQVELVGAEPGHRTVSLVAGLGPEPQDSSMRRARRPQRVSRQEGRPPTRRGGRTPAPSRGHEVGREVGERGQHERPLTAGAGAARRGRARRPRRRRSRSRRRRACAAPSAPRARGPPPPPGRGPRRAARRGERACRAAPPC